jgi:hypothetical protein
MVQRAETASPRHRKQLTDEAIRLAMAGDWKAAEAANLTVLDSFPDDVEAANRLGKALTELGKPKQAIEAYQRALEIDSFNPIARKNLERLEQATKASGKSPKASKSTAAKAGKGRGTTGALVASATAAEFPLQQANPVEVAQLEPGDAATLQANARGVAVLSEEDTILGYIEPKAGLRLKRMIGGGNRYDVTIRSVDGDGNAVVFIRETYRDGSLVGQASFLPSAEAKRKAPRAYTRRSALVEEDAPDLGQDDEDDNPLGTLREVENIEDVDDIDDDDDGDITDERDDDGSETDSADADDEYEPEEDA